MLGKSADAFLVCALLLILFGGVLGGGAAWGAHNSQSDLASICYDCHTLNAMLADNNTSFINSSSRTLPQMRSVNGGISPGNYSPTGRVFGCTYCHNDALRTIQGKAMKDSLNPFLAKPSQHPVDRSYTKDGYSNIVLGPNIGSTLYMSNWDNSWAIPPDQLDCVDCHDANANGGSYPNHPIPGTGSRAPAVNPFMLRNTTAMDNNHAPNSFCLATCHSGAAPGTSGWRMGHYGWGAFDNAGTLATLKEHDGTALKTSKCVNCHETHSTNAKPNLMGEQRQSILNVDPADCTTQCHNNARFLSAGHGKAGVNLGCANCHTSAVSHRDTTNPKRFGGSWDTNMASLAQNVATNGLDDDLNGVIDDGGEANFRYSMESNCSLTCHSDKRGHQGTIGATSGSASCLHCHDPHGKGTDNNARMVRRTVMGKETLYFSTADLFRADNSATRASMCDNPSCHAKPLGNTSTPGTIMYDVPDHRDAAVGVGYNCISCHNHSSTTGAASFSAVCNACHTYPGQAVLAGTRVLGGVHTKHIGSDNVGGYGYTCSTCHFLYTHNQSAVTGPGDWGTKFSAGNVDIRFDGTLNPANANGPRYAGVPADSTQPVPAPGVGGTGRCDGLYCHGNSTDAVVWSGRTASGPTWDNAASGACGTCHGVTAASPPVDYAHPKHATQNGYSCQTCHWPTTHDGTTIYAKSNHVNRVKNVDDDSAVPILDSFAYAPGSPTGSCSTTNCHGGGTVAWNATGPLACDVCHGGAADVNDFTRDNTTMSRINTGAEWTTYGHGGRGAPPKVCASCHDSAVPHDNSATLSGPNPFRLTAGFTCSNTGAGCHQNSPAKDVVTHADNAMIGYTPKRNWTWRPECVNCHDPHGDATNLSMIQRELYDKARFSLPAGPPPAQPTEQTTLVFTDNALGVGLNSYAWITTNTPSYSGVCQECHEDPNHVSFKDGVPAPGQATSPVGSNHPSTGANPGKCTDCHQHAAAFQPSGCNGCHGSTSNGRYWPANVPGAYPNRAGAHDNHVLAISQYLYGQDLTALLADAATDAKQKAICAWCHPNPGGSRAGTGEASHSDYVAPADVHRDGRAGAAASYLQYYNGNLATPGSDNNTAATYDNTTLSCSNTRCHNNNATPSGANNWRTPPAWSTAGCASTQCHAAPAAASGAHNTHYAPKNAGMAYPCSECHVVPSSLRHANGQVNLSFAGLEATRGGGNGYYDKDNSNTLTAGDNNFKAFDNVYARTCFNLYCHGGDNPWGGTDNTPVWNDPATGNCGTCHGVYGSPYVSGSGAAMVPVITGNHQVHFRQYNSSGVQVVNRGPQLDPHPGNAGGGCNACHNVDLNCTTACHQVHGSAGANQPTGTHADGNADFRSDILVYPPGITDPNTGVTLAATPACNNCHSTATVVTAAHPSPGTTGVAASKGNWDNVAYRLDCLTCHNGIAPANSNSGGNGLAAPNLYGNGSTYGAEARGHNRKTAAGPYPVTSNPAANRSCTDCHDASVAHINNVNDNTFAGNRLLATVNGNATGSTVSGLCAACHTTAGASPATKKSINTHGNTGYPGRLEAVFADRACNQCHEAHGMVNVTAAPAGVNIWMINPTITVATGITQSPVRLFDRSGANSFDNTGTASDLCRACHANAANPGFPMTWNVAGQHAAPAYAGDERGKDCSGCHSHNQDGNIATVDGLMPLACNGCHSYPGLDNTGVNLKQMSRGHWKHVGQPLPVGSATNNKGYECTLCHFSYTHNQTGLSAGQAWPGGYFTNVNIRFDNVWNPGSPTYNGQPAGAVAAPGNGGTGACAALYCHGGNATLNADWAGTDNTPSWNGTAVCGTCHRAGSTLAQGRHPAHLSAVYGPGIGSFSAGGTCSEGTGCHTAYDLSPAGAHANNQGSFRTSVSVAAPVALGATQICVNCHTTYTSANIPVSGDTLARTQANWDNASYFLPCITCHNGTAAGTQATADIGGTGARAAAIEGTYFASGHGLYGFPAPLECGWCHNGGMGHIGANRPIATNPWRIGISSFSSLGRVDSYCSTDVCHGSVPPNDHTWIANGAGYVTAKEAADTHPTTALAVPAGKDRWFRVPPSTHVPLFGNLLDLNYNKSGGANNYVLCVSCHDPHGVAATPLSSTVRTFSGQNTDAKGNKMLRFNYSSGSPTALCAECHL